MQDLVLSVCVVGGGDPMGSPISTWENGTCELGQILRLEKGKVFLPGHGARPCILEIPAGCVVVNSHSSCKKNMFRSAANIVFAFGRKRDSESQRILEWITIENKGRGGEN